MFCLIAIQAFIFGSVDVLLCSHRGGASMFQSGEYLVHDPSATRHRLERSALLFRQLDAPARHVLHTVARASSSQRCSVPLPISGLILPIPQDVLMLLISMPVPPWMFLVTRLWHYQASHSCLPVSALCSSPTRRTCCSSDSPVPDVTMLVRSLRPSEHGC